ncbi:hypothetical protein SDC9_60090 [bioreactor metagenome]|uniref:Uncharacterized protein n=1 Tax=bioreactor metagenome TaxID=1076179 RepID=A0A644XDB3_9ZZZZ
MNTSKQAILLMMVLLMAVCASAQNKEREGETRNDTVVNLQQSISDPASVVLFRNDRYVISASFQQFRTNLSNWISKNPGISGDEKLLELVDNAAINSKAIDAVQLAEKSNIVDRLRFRLADMLQQGQCMIYDKKKYSPVASVTVQTYTYVCGPLCGDGGRRFFIDGELLFEITDWIS